MPVIDHDGVPIYYESAGGGQALLLISGLGGGTWSWYGQVPFFRAHFRTITIDNRGAGRSGGPPGPYRMAQFAGDALAVLDDLGVDQALVMGLSMGGMIAQELVLTAPERVRALVLGCTHCGGERRVPPDPATLAAFIDNRGLDQEQIITKNLPFFFSRTCFEQHPEVIETYRQIQLASPLQTEAAFVAQLEAIRAFDAAGRLGQIRTPTLVIAGTEDLLVPFENACILASAIAGARLIALPGAGHAIHAECADQLNRSVLEFFCNVRA